MCHSKPGYGRWVHLLALAAVLFTFTASVARAGGYLWCGTDHEEFSGTKPSFLGAYRVDGVTATPLPGAPFALPVDPLIHLNGLYATGGYLTAGNPETNTMSDVTYVGGYLSGPTAVPAIPDVCCNEDMALDMRDNFNVSVWHVYYNNPGGRIDRLQVASHNLISSHPIDDAVGITIVDCDIWISLWSGRAVGTFDPTTNKFTPVFFTKAQPGGLAFDPTSRLLWIGFQGGEVTPFTLAGVQAGPTVVPFGPLGGNTVDGLDFVADNVSCCDRRPFASINIDVKPADQVKPRPPLKPANQKGRKPTSRE
jgi:hypothetical protein